MVVVTEHDGLGLVSLNKVLRVVTVSSDMRWCTGALLGLASDLCVRVKVGR